eukprot:7266005-Prymnesium_polylepis.1
MDTESTPWQGAMDAQRSPSRDLSPTFRDHSPPRTPKQASSAGAVHGKSSVSLSPHSPRTQHHYRSSTSSSLRRENEVA